MPPKHRVIGYWKCMRIISREREPIYKALSTMSPRTKVETDAFIESLIKEHMPASATKPADLAKAAKAIFRRAKARLPAELVPYTRGQWQGSYEHASIDEVLGRRKLQREKEKQERAAGAVTCPKITPELVASFIPDAGIRLPDLVLIVCRAARVDPKRVHSAFRKAQRAGLVKLEKSTWFRASKT